MWRRPIGSSSENVKLGCSGKNKAIPEENPWQVG
jgi:hypothetical protein